MNRLARYVLAALGPVATAGAQFLLSLLLLRSLPPAAFGGFSFLLIAATLATSVWSAMFCAPLLVFMTQRREQGADQAAKAVLMASVVGAAIATVGFAALALATGFPAEASVIFAFFASLGLVRWLGRAHAYALGHQTRTIASDVVYAVSLMGGIGLLFTLEAITLDHAYLVLLVATVAGIGALGRPYASALLIAPTPAVLRGYRRVWREHSSWSLAGVVSTEATVNCHAYLVTAICGPAAFAPIAATQLLIRPITVATNALMEFERAQMARQLGEGVVDSAAHALRLFRMVLAGVCLLVGLAVLALFLFAPRLLFPAHYAMPVLVTGAASWLTVAFIRAIRTPESALLQAAGAFRPLAMASIYSAAFSIATVATVLVFAQPIWSVAGVLGGELVFLYWVWRKAWQWIASARRPDPGARGGEVAGAWAR
ncbi:hypothetical protein [Novosphingobium sp. LASN5T]|uniref:hypothetical protein n=1 Tax=Novosphingobium sp. LASN5T TaxID=2491021 RepID=UPI000F5D5B2D|nr:hypothetical protein [Novosphingobium sp. LASN5T]RQW45482.1 hypothetical protein EH199_04265 [Novosphingobium sp. LASN5T]